jgi:hypothetical protein
VYVSAKIYACEKNICLQTARAHTIRMSHRRFELSLDADSSCVERAQHCTAVTSAKCAVSVRRATPDRRSHTRTAPSLPPVKRSCPSGENERQVTWWECARGRNERVGERRGRREGVGRNGKGNGMAKREEDEWSE